MVPNIATVTAYHQLQIIWLSANAVHFHRAWPDDSFSSQCLSCREWDETLSFKVLLKMLSHSAYHTRFTGSTPLASDAANATAYTPLILESLCLLTFIILHISLSSWQLARAYKITSVDLDGNLCLVSYMLICPVTPMLETVTQWQPSTWIIWINSPIVTGQERSRYNAGSWRPSTLGTVCLMRSHADFIWRSESCTFVPMFIISSSVK